MTTDHPAPIRSEALDGAVHGFFDRRGGVSTGLYATLNCGPGSADRPEAVAENRARVAAALGVAPARLLSPRQSHSALAMAVDATTPEGDLRCDALASRDPDLAVAALAADCAPVLLLDAEAGVVGAAHAGWRGAFGGVLEAALEAMASLGAAPRRVTAVVGPCISQSAYEVGPDFVEAFVAASRDNARFFSGGREDRSMFDLPGYCLMRLREAGVARSTWLGLCTYSDPQRFFSHRRTVHAGEEDYGRLIAAIRAPRR